MTYLMQYYLRNAIVTYFMRIVTRISTLTLAALSEYLTWTIIVVKGYGPSSFLVMRVGEIEVGS